MKKIAINTSYGGFDLSSEAELLYWQKKYPEEEITAKKESYNSYSFFLGDKQLYPDFYREGAREEQPLIEVIETLGEKANSICSDLKIVEIPDDVVYTIEEYDGKESIHEVHRIWK